MRSMIIIGAGGFGREVYQWALQSLAQGVEWKVRGFLDDNVAALAGKSCSGPLLGKLEDHEPAPEEVFVCAIGNPVIKKHCVETILGRGGRFDRIIHRTSVVTQSASIGVGTILCPYSVVSSDVRIGEHVGINLHATVDHDAVVGDWSQINCHADVTGGVVLEEAVFVGSHASILPRVRIGRGATIGAGAIVMQSVPEGVTVTATPARPLRL